MSNPYLKVSYHKQPWYNNALRTGRAILGRTLSQTGAGIARAINYAGQGVIQAAELGANAFPWYRKLPSQDKLGQWYTKNVFTPNDKFIDQAELNDKRYFSYPEDMSNSTKQILDHAVVTPLDMLGSYATGSWVSKVPAVVNYGSRYANKVYPMLRKAVEYTMGNSADVLAYGGQAIDGVKKAVNYYLNEK